MLNALEVSPTGDFPLASMLLDLPKLILHRDEFWLVQAVMAPVMFGICASAIYLLVSFGVWAVGRRGPKLNGREGFEGSINGEDKKRTAPLRLVG